MSTAARQPLSTPQKIMIPIIIALAAFFLWSCVQGGGESDEGINGVRYPDREAIAGCESLVEEQLRSPASAEFDSTVTSDDGEWTVTGSVDADNAFGASVRTDYTCTVTFPGDGQVRTVIDDIG